MTRGAAVVTLSALSAILVSLALGPAAEAADLKPATLAAFDRYVKATEQRIAGETSGHGPFIFVDGMAERDRREALDQLRRGDVVVERLTTLEGGKKVKIDDGLIHHWVGVVFVPGATVGAAVDLLQDYDAHARIYSPAIQASRILSRDGDRFTVFLRFYMKKVIAATVNTENLAVFERPAPDRAYSSLHSTRVAEVEDPGTPEERERPVGHDSGFVWRLNTYWRFLERDGGAYIQCESVSLSRDIPFGLSWIIKPFITQVPRDTLTYTLARTRDTLIRQEGQ
jgi:hypothetical protein